MSELKNGCIAFVEEGKMYFECGTAHCIHRTKARTNVFGCLSLEAGFYCTSKPARRGAAETARRLAGEYLVDEINETVGAKTD